MVMKDGPYPDKFYKYRSMRGDDIQWVERIVLHNELYFAPAIKFNDPFDLRPSLSFEAPDQVRLSDVRRLVHQFMPGLSPAQVEAESHRLALATYDPVYIDKMAADLREQLAEMLTEKIGVFCVSANRDDILMWSHYADSHGGVCLEFDEACPTLAQALKVIYSEARSPINRFEDDPETMSDKALLTKSDHWEYEAEWRSIRYDEGPGIVSFQPEHLTGVIIGARASAATIAKVEEWTRARPTPWTVYRASVSNDRFELEIAPVSL